MDKGTIDSDERANAKDCGCGCGHKKRLKKGYVHVYTGDGKGKTTAALGLAIRAVGHDMKAFVIHFMKGNIEYGELQTAKRLAPNLEIRQMGRESFVDRKNPDPIDVEMASKALALAEKVILGGEFDLVVLDEINVAADFGLVSVNDVLDLIRKKPDHVEIVMTGRYAHEKFIEEADLVTQMKCVKHYFDKGVQARVGIER